MNSSTLLATWLARIDAIHPKQIALGLDRVKTVADRLGLTTTSSMVIIVAGTNGKGSTVAGLEAIYLAANFQVGTFTSPVLFHHREQVRINGECASDEDFCRAFEAIDKARGEILLTPFEFQTLAALFIFANTKKHLDVLILEVGLGGRLDAVNIIDADLAIVTSIDIDHKEWLGETREAIAGEKAHVFRKGKPAICGDPNPPHSLLNVAKEIGANLFCQGRDFTYQDQTSKWSWFSQTLNLSYQDLPVTPLALQNLSTVLLGITLLQEKLKVSEEAIKLGLSQVSLPGRIEIVGGPFTKIFDVSHNPAAIALLAKKLKELPTHKKTYAVFSMLADKDIAESIRMIHSQIDEWFIAPLQTKRAASLEMLLSAFKDNQKVVACVSVEKAYQTVIAKCVPGDRVIILGSFHTVAECYYSVSEK